jgi:SP family sugar:H+ symporter-like MFS transporter
MLGMSQFQKDFGVFNPETAKWAIPSTWQSVGSGPPTAGVAVGCLIAGAVGNWLGRLNTFRLASTISILGVLIEATAISSYWQIVAGRIIVGLSLGILANVTPAYLAEVAPLSIRGTIINAYQFSIGAGAVLVNTANWGMHGRTDQWAYRLSILSQFLIPTILIPYSFFVPESPRWLIGKGRTDEALKALVHLRTNTSREVIEQEAQLMAAQENENKQTFGGTWADCFKWVLMLIPFLIGQKLTIYHRGTNLRRTLIATGVQCLQQAQGSSFMSTYAVVFFQNLGIKDEYRIIVLLLLVQTLASAFAFYLPDRFGRRRILISMAIVMGLCMLFVSLIMGFSFANNAQGLNAATACVFIWQFATSIGWSSW